MTDWVGRVVLALKGQIGVASPSGKVGNFSNEHGFSMKSSLQRISSIFLIVETKRFVDSFSNVILTRQTCDQRSSRAAESKRRALDIYFYDEFESRVFIEN